MSAEQRDSSRSAAPDGPEVVVPEDRSESDSIAGEIDDCLTPVRKHSEISTVSDASSLLRETSSPFPILTPSGSKDTEDYESEGGKPGESVCPKWSEVLRSPSKGQAFSPSLEWNKPGHLHGLGLRAATDRAKRLSHTGRRCASLLNDVATLQSAFAQDILKACQTQFPLNAPKLSGKFRSVQRSLVSFANQIQGIVVSVRGSVARPLNSSMAAMGETVPNIFDRYIETRIKCTAARSAALRARAKYVYAVQQAEAAIREMQRAKEAGDAAKQTKNPPVKDDTSDTVDQSSSTTGIQSLEKKIQTFGRKYNVSPEKLIVLLNDVKLLEAKYKELVADENQAIALSEMMEAMALEALQKLEEERIQFFVETMSRALEAEKGALDKMVLSTTSVELTEPSTPIVKAEEEKKPKDFFKTLLKTQEDEDGVGVMEAETLGLPEELGLLRDKAKGSLTERSTRCDVVRSLAGFLEAVAVAANTLASGLQARLQQEGYPESSSGSSKTLLPALIRKSEGPRVLTFWDGIVMGIEDNEETARHLAFTFRNIRQSHLDNFVLQAEREIKNAADADDQRWKQLCHAARQESKALNRYQQTVSQFEKARDRVRSVDDELSTASANRSRRGSANQMGSATAKALGNMFSILPDGGEGAMQMLTPNARMAVAKKTLKEANERESKDKETLEAAEAVKKGALNSYTTSAQLLIDEYEKDSERSWADVNSALESIVSSAAEFRSDRYNAIIRVSSAAPSRQAMACDMADWTERAKWHVGKKNAGSDSTDSASAFKLIVNVEESRNMYKLLSLLVGSDTEFSLPTEEAAPKAERLSTREGDTPLASTSEIEGTAEGYTPTEEAEKYLTEQVREGLSASTKRLAPTEDLLSEDKMLSTSAPDKLTTRRSSSTLAETDIFVANFWSEHGNGAPPPAIIQSFTCAYWPKEGEGYLSPLLHGRLFVTAKTMYFVGWGEKKIVLQLQDAVKVEKATNLMGAIDNSLRITYLQDEDESFYYFGSFVYRDDAFELLSKLVTIEQSLREIHEEKKDIKALPVVKEDHVIKKMELLFTKTIKNISILKFYEVVWSEGQGTDASPLYGPWLESLGSREICVPEWEIAQDGSPGILNEWCGERYKQKRVVTYEFTRTTHLYVGPPVAKVKQTQYCTVDESDTCVVQTTVEFDGIPYGDCFNVEIRWAARRIDANDVRIDVASFVNFKKSTLFAKQIRTGTVSETRPVHLKLFEAIKKACSAASGKEVVEEEEEEKEEVEEEELKPEKAAGGLDEIRAQLLALVPFDVSDRTKTLIVGFLAFTILRLFSYAIGRRRRRARIPLGGAEQLNERIDELEIEIKEIHKTLQAILKALQEERRQ